MVKFVAGLKHGDQEGDAYRSAYPRGSTAVGQGQGQDEATPTLIIDQFLFKKLSFEWVLGHFSGFSTQKHT